MHVVRKVAPDLRGQLGDPCLDLVRSESRISGGSQLGHKSRIIPRSENVRDHHGKRTRACWSAAIHVIAEARGGHITPLAADTLNDRRITVVREGSVSDDDASLVPRRRYPFARRSAAITRASRCAGQLVAFLRSRGLAVNDLGTEWHRAGGLSRTWRPRWPTPWPERRGRRRHRHRRRGHRFGHRGEQMPRYPRGDGDDGDHRPLSRANTTGPMCSRWARRCSPWTRK